MAHSNDVITGELPLRELAWSYLRGSQRQHCVLSLDATRRIYELRIRVDGMRETLRKERFNFVSQALARQCEYEAQILAVGFSLEAFAARSRVN